MADGDLVPPTKGVIAYHLRELAILDPSTASGFVEQQAPGGGRSSVHYWGVGDDGRGVQGELDLSWQRKR